MWDDEDWRTLVQCISSGKCTPFLGAGACYDLLPKGAELAEEWAAKFGYPFKDRHNLVRVAQYVATMKGLQKPGLEIKERFDAVHAHKQGRSNYLLDLLADLPFSVYLTTNYDFFLANALSGRHRRPTVTFCQWFVAGKKRIVRERLNPTVATPVVFHLHGHYKEVDSIVVTEDDYIEYLSAITDQETLIPAVIEGAFGNSALLFLGYSLDDLNLRLLLRKLARFFVGNRFMHVAVQYSPETDAEGRLKRTMEEEKTYIDKQIEYLTKRYANLQIKLYLGDCDSFSRRLKLEWERFQQRELLTT